MNSSPRNHPGSMLVGVGAALLLCPGLLLADPPASPTKGLDASDAIEQTFRERNGPVFEGWQKPRVAIVFTGELDGYIEPCGCTGKENQKGGLSRRQNFLRAMESAGWPLLPVDLGNQVRRFGRQSEVKFQSIADGLKQMGYESVGFGPADLRLPAEEVVAAVAAVGDAQTPFVSANVGLLGLDADITPRYRIVKAGGRTIGITSVIDDAEAKQVRNDAVEVVPAAAALERVVAKFSEAKCDHRILLAWASPEETAALAARFPQFDLVAMAGGGDEPPAQLEPIAGGKGTGQRRLVKVGHKGMFAVVVGLYDDPAQPVRSQRVPLDARWGESKDMIRLLASYQGQLESLGLTGLGLQAIRHPTGRRFAGSAACASCHAHAYEVWKDTPHATALATLEEQSPRRNGDPECLSCHVVGWVPQRFEPYEGGFAGMKKSPHLAHNGCENCHGPAAAHAAVERGDVRATSTERDRLRAELAMSIETPEGRQRTINNCMECHDLDNSPQFEFDDYWPQVEHNDPEKTGPEAAEAKKTAAAE